MEPAFFIVENNNQDNFNDLPSPSRRTGVFWNLLAPVLGVQQERYPRPGSLDWELDAVARRDARIAAANAPPTHLHSIVSDIVDEVKEVAGKAKTKIEMAREWLIERLSEGPVPATVIESEGAERGWNLKTLKLAKKRLRVGSARRSGVWRWFLPLATVKGDGTK